MLYGSEFQSFGYQPAMPVFGVFDELPYQGAWLKADMYAKATHRREYSPRTIQEDKYNHKWTLKERDDGRTIEIGKFYVLLMLIVNATSPVDYDAVHLKIEYNGKTYSVTIPARDYRKRNILPYLDFIERNPDCPDKHLISAIYLAIQGAKAKKFLVTLSRSGFSAGENGEIYFGCSGNMYPGLEVYYPQDIRERQLVSELRALVEIAKDYAEALPKIWQYKLLVAVRIASLLLYFTAADGTVADQLLVVEPASRSASKVAIALLKTQNYQSQDLLSLMATNTELKAYLSKINDGMTLFYDDSYVEEQRKRNARVQTLLDDLHGTNGIEDNPRHLITILSENPANLPPEIPAMYLNISDKVLCGDPDKLQRLSGEFDSALIEAILNDPKNMAATIKVALLISKIEMRTISNSENINFKRIVRGGMYIMEKYKLINNDEKKAINNWLDKGAESGRESALSIVEDFRDVLNKLLFNKLAVVSQTGAPYYAPGEDMVFVDADYINFEAGVWERFLKSMKKTKKRKKVLNSLEKLGLIHGNNGYKRNKVVEVAPDETRIVSVYSVSNRLLDTDKISRIKEIMFADYAVDIGTWNMVNPRPLITNKNKTVLYGQVNDEDSNHHQWISAASGFGKTVYQINQAVASAMSDEQVVVFDNSGAWSEREIKKCLNDDDVDGLFSFWSIPKQGVPVNLANLDNCETLPEKKQRIFGILASGTRGLGNVQGKALYKRIGDMLKDKKEDVEISDILEYLDEKEQVQDAIRSKLEDVFEDFEDSPINYDSWKDFLSKKKKIVVISTGNDGVAKGSHEIDMLLASLYAFKQYTPDERVTVILDECQDLYIDTDGPIDVMLRKGRKYGIRMLLASQEFSAVNDKLGKIIGNCGTLVFFRPKVDNLAAVSKLTGVDKATLSRLEAGECVVHGLLFNQPASKNKQTTILGWTFRY